MDRYIAQSKAGPPLALATFQRYPQGAVPYMNRIYMPPPPHSGEEGVTNLKIPMFSRSAVFEARSGRAGENLETVVIRGETKPTAVNTDVLSDISAYNLDRDRSLYPPLADVENARGTMSRQLTGNPLSVAG